MPSSSVPRRNPRGAFSALVFAAAAIAVLAVTAVWFWIQAPDVVPSHFDVTGRPDEWSSKSEILGILVPIGIGIPVLFSIRWIWESLPTSIVNIPNKDHWLELGEDTYLYDCLMQFMRTLGGAIALLFTAILVIMFKVGQGAESSVIVTLVPVAGFLVVSAAALWILVRQLDPRR
ncbi:DUF1648 domain-containing protein [Brevibacterium aurantiacum]|uniref:DUF1648 domain-containing protein n=1 Tax=Brevibacterium aurantiacum TaxID=273384 RepID=A0A3Q9NQQ6_BREAU|nr:DUF1648 domain-containing protein [Brevibacterium aurantiacum]AZT92746.1 hypothetical protein CXR23_06005 [Brevibacterium aurantiacum]